MQARRYVVPNIRCVSRTIVDLPPVASDDELVAWGQELTTVRPLSPTRPNRPLVATRIKRTMTTEEILLDISERATAVFERRRITVRRSSPAGRTSTS